MKWTIETLVKRDGLTESEAKELIQETLNCMQDAIERGDYSDAEEIWLDETGLEMDYYLDCAFLLR